MHYLKLIVQSEVPGGAKELLMKSNVNEYQYWLSEALNNTLFYLPNSFNCGSTDMQPVSEIPTRIPIYVYNKLFSIIGIAVIIAPFKSKIRKIFKSVTAEEQTR